MNKLKGFPRPLLGIRMKCVDCAGGSHKAVRFCSTYDCGLWAFRFGQRPATYIKKYGKETRVLFEIKHFKENGEYAPNLEINELKV